MKKEIKKIPKYKQVQDGFSEVEVFITKDNREFKNDVDAINHEADLVSEEEFDKKYHHFNETIDGIDYDVLIIDELTEENITEISNKFWHIKSSDLRVGVNLIYTDDTGDHTFQSVSHINDMIKYLENQIEEIKSSKSYKKSFTLM